MPSTFITGPGSRIVEFAWNPVLASMLAVVFSNGSAALYMVDAADGAKAPGRQFNSIKQIKAII